MFVLFQYRLITQQLTSPIFCETRFLIGLSNDDSKAKKKILFVSCNGPKKNRVGRSVKNLFLHYLFGQKCVFYAHFTLIGSSEGGKNFRVGIFLNKNLLG